MAFLAAGDIEEGVALRQKGLYSEAEHAFQRALYVGQEDSARARAELAITYYQWKKYPEALSLFSELMPVMNDEMWDYYLDCLLKVDSGALVRLADSLARTGDTLSLKRALHGAWALEDDSLADAVGRRLLGLDPASPGAGEYVEWVADMALALPDSERIERIASLQEAMWRSPEFYKPLRIKVVSMIRSGDTSGAVQELKTWCDRKPDDPQLLASACGLSVILGLDIPEAKAWGKRALEMALEVPFEANGLETSRERWLRVLFYQALASGEQDPDLWDKASLPPTNNALGLVSLYHYTMGTLELARGNTLQARQHFLLSVVAGAPRNTWPKKSLKALSDMGVKDPQKAARELLDYSGPLFVDRTEELGFPEGFKSSRVAVGDYNGDGWEDILCKGRLFENQKGKVFKEVTDRVGLSGVRGAGALFLDYNRDGWDDILITGKKERLFENQKGKVFQEVTDRVGLSDTFPTEGASGLDLNGDGWPEIYLANYEMGGLGKGTPDVLYMNHGGRFQALSPAPETLCGRGVAPGDFDLDGDIDLYITNYRLQRNFFYINEKGRLEERALALGVAGRNRKGWFGHSIGAEWGDFDMDGDFDLIVCNLAHPRYIDVSEKTVLYEATGVKDAPFQDVAQEAGILYDECHSEPLWGDFDLDGDLDLFITSVYQNERSYLYQNLLTEPGEAKFQDITYLAGARVFNGWGSGALDFDHDGDLDIAVGSGSGFSFLVNETPVRHSWLEIEGLPRGAVVRLVAGDRVFLRQVEFAKGTTSQNPPVLHFGLGDVSGPVVAEVSLGGKKKTRRISTLNKRVRLRAP